MNFSPAQQFQSLRQPCDLRNLLDTLQDVTCTRLYTEALTLTLSQIDEVIVIHEDFPMVHPVLKESMRLTGISLGGDRGSVQLDFTDVTLGVEYWSLPMQDLQPGELITLIESCEQVKSL